jgi:serine protease Do
MLEQVWRPRDGPIESFMKLHCIAKVLMLTVVVAGIQPTGRAAETKSGSSALELARQLNQAFIELADKVSPAVVVVRVAHKASYVDPDDEENPFFEMLPPELRRQWEEQRERLRKEQEQQRRFHREPIFSGEGSGVVIRKEGYIHTNRHVVDGAEKIKIVLKDGTEFDGEVRGVDAQSDVAVIKIDAKDTALTVAKLADSDKTRVGEFAIAIGAPFNLDYSVTFGHVSAKGRSAIIQDKIMDQDFIQTDASINPGNSGGPLVNIDGEVIGINTLIRGLRTGIGFAIPSNLAREISDRLITDGKYVRAFLGVEIKPLKGDNDYRDLITGINDGVVIVKIPPYGPAAKSDLKPGDVITAVEGVTVSTAQQLKNEIRGKKIGVPVTLDVHRFGKNIKVKVKPEAWPDEMEQLAVKRSPAADDKTGSFGLTVETVTKESAEQYGLEKVEGLLVSEVQRGSAAERKGIKPGDVITEVNGKAVSTPRQFHQAVKQADPKKGVMVLFNSRGTSKVERLRDSGE